MLATIGKLILTWFLKFLSNAAKRWHEQELRDWRNRQAGKRAVEQIVQEAKEHDEEIGDNPESLRDSIDRLRRLADARAERRALDSESVGPSAPIGFHPGRALRAREERIAGTGDGDESSVSTPVVTGAGRHPGNESSSA